MKKNKEKVTYYDDGRTISDMSNVNGGLLHSRANSSKPRVKEKEKLKTFFTAFKMMLIPTGVALLVLLILYIIFTLIGKLA